VLDSTIAGPLYVGAVPSNDIAQKARPNYNVVAEALTGEKTPWKCMFPQVW